MLTITAPLVTLIIITQDTSLPNVDDIKEAAKIITPKKEQPTEQPSNLPISHQRLKQTWVRTQKERSFKLK